jgi:hypothetical protein
MGQIEQDSRDKTTGTGQPENTKRIVQPGLPEQDSKGRRARTGQLAPLRQDSRGGQSGQVDLTG